MKRGIQETNIKTIKKIENQKKKNKKK